MRLEQEEILHRFQEWLTQTNRELDQFADETLASAGAAPSPPAGLLTLVEAFTSLRHELKLQTKSARGLEESLQTALTGLDRAIASFGSVEPRETAAAEKAMRPLVEALIELDEALRRGTRAVAASQQRLSEELPRRLMESLEQRFAGQSAWRRWRSGPWQAEVLQCCRQLVAETQGPLLASLGDGYQLICGRLQRMLTEQRIERLDCAGQPVDPSQMRVIELVDAPGVPPETVVEEIRPGYVWRGHVLRYAEVRATRAAPQHEADEDKEAAEDSNAHEITPSPRYSGERAGVRGEMEHGDVIS